MACADVYRYLHRLSLAPNKTMVVRKRLGDSGCPHVMFVHKSHWIAQILPPKGSVTPFSPPPIFRLPCTTSFCVFSCCASTPAFLERTTLLHSSTGVSAEAVVAPGACPAIAIRDWRNVSTEGGCERSIGIPKDAMISTNPSGCCKALVSSAAVEEA